LHAVRNEIYWNRIKIMFTIVGLARVVLQASSSYILRSHKLETQYHISCLFCTSLLRRRVTICEML